MIPQGQYESLHRMVFGHPARAVYAVMDGAMIEGLWNMPANTTVRVELSADKSVTAQVRWSRENRAGIEFHQPLHRSPDGSFAVLKGPAASVAAW